MRLERLRCGVIFTGAFQDHLEAWWRSGAEENFGLVPELDYVRCASGARAGQSWITLVWRPLKGVRAHEIYQVGKVKLHLSKGARTALKERCLDAREGRVVVV